MSSEANPASHPVPHEQEATHPQCEACGRDAEFQFLDETPGTPRRWRRFCGEHAHEYLLGLPETVHRARRI